MLCNVIFKNYIKIIIRQKSYEIFCIQTSQNSKISLNETEW